MSRIMSRVKDLSQKALAVKEALDQAPETVEEIRRTFAETAEQLQQLKSDVQDTVVELKTEPEFQVAEVLKELNTCGEVLRKAGVEMTGVDLETRPTKRLIVHLQKRDPIVPATLQSLLQANPDHGALRMLLSSLEQVEPILRSVRFDKLELGELLVVLGPVPSLRVCWRGNGMVETAQAAPQTSFFEKRAAAPEAVTIPEVPTPIPATSVTALSTPLAEAAKWTSAALDRFKKMPTGSKYGK